MSEEVKQDGLQEEEIQAETAETAQEEEAAEAPAEEKKEMSAEDEALNMKYMRLMADFQNFKRRTEKEKSDIYAFANEKIVSELLNVIDNFERALALGQEGDSFVEGMNLILKQLQGFRGDVLLECVRSILDTFKTASFSLFVPLLTVSVSFKADGL